MGFTIYLFMLRWLHFIFGIIWIGHLYFFNFVNAPLGKVLDAGTKKAVVPQLMPRALWWFRWGAMFTFITGWVYLLSRQAVAPGGHGALLESPWGQWITLGGALGSIMWFNVWFIIWPAQKKIIGWVKRGESPAEMAGLVKRAGSTSRLNTYLSFPMLFCMGAASHLPVFNLFWVVTAFVVGIALVWHLVNKVAGKAGTNF